MSDQKYKVAQFSGITGCGIFHSGYVVAIVPPKLPENLWHEAAKIEAVSRRKKYATEIKQETERIAKIVCEALNAEEPA